MQGLFGADKDVYKRQVYGRAWTFKTKPAPALTGPNYEVKISHTDPNADFYTLQGAIAVSYTHLF